MSKDPSTRMHVYVALDEERNYQDKKHADDKHSVSEWLTIMGSYANKANEAFAKGGDRCLETMLDCMRKITASGVACMEQNGVVSRDDGPQPVCDVCGSSEAEHKPDADHVFIGAVFEWPSEEAESKSRIEAKTKRRADLIKKLNEEFTPAGDAALSALKAETPIMSDLRKSVEGTLNKFSAENGSSTPDFILAQYLIDCLSAYDKAVVAREKWYGREPKPVPDQPEGPKPNPVGRPFLSSI